MSATAEPIFDDQTMTYVLVPSYLLAACDREQVVAGASSPEEMIRVLLLRELVVNSVRKERRHVLP